MQILLLTNEHIRRYTKLIQIGERFKRELQHTQTSSLDDLCLCRINEQENKCAAALLLTFPAISGAEPCTASARAMPPSPILQLYEGPDQVNQLSEHPFKKQESNIPWS